MNRRTFLLGTASGFSVLALAACVTPQPVPSPSVTPSTLTPSIVPQPLTVSRTNWSSDPFSRGSFSYAAVGATPEHRVDLGQSVDARVFFAGEATAAEEPGTVQGARASGLLAASQVRDVAAPGERITVIGAGIAGITAARQLVDDGFNVVVIEARDRIGGRIDTVSGDWPFPIERGPSFVHRTSVDFLDDELTALGVRLLPFARTPEVRTRAGAVVDVSPLGAQAVAGALSWAASQQQDVSVERALIDSGEASLSKTPNAEGLSDADWLEYEIATKLKVESGATPSQQSAWYTTDIASTDDDQIVIGGYSTLLNSDAEGLELLLSKVVNRVAHDNNGVSLRLGTGESLSADRVIVTVPLGVLKDAAIEFSPALPFSHRGAIAALGMGVVDKIWLRFDVPFWDTSARLWTIVGEDADFPVWINMMPLTGEPVLMGLVAAENATRLSELDDDAFLAAALTGLEPFLAVPDAK
ncbi:MULTISPECIES: flavin monoamine oxidase family protein [Cryobacterium]|uniref:FAD-dependent oxidoreductase n=1 Tax=Cryobacterium lyxosi TaxID=1259228 RepID=A0A4R8ZCZ1_9MICO|nr:MULTISPECIES: NAD(P)/FAD-dependent oxidoreductase [Cryobacterium]TFD25202.1 FAD-dependent oxidoreductase [Cryobacterium lyxosi]